MSDAVSLTSEDIQRAMRAWEEHVEANVAERSARQKRDAVIDKLLADLSGRVGNTNTLTFTGAPAAAWVAATCAGVSMLLVMLFAIVFSVLFGVAFLFFAARDDWAAGEFNTVRTFIHTGRLQPMQPRPGLVDSLQPTPAAQPERKP